jgi:hypothetical protein
MAERKWFKGRASMALDAWYRDGDVGANLRQARDLLQSGQSFADIVAQLVDVRRWNTEFEYPDPVGGALQGPEFESVARQGYLEAIALALGHAPSVPIETFWMTGAGNARFEMHIADEAEHVAVTVLVPDVEGGSELPGSPESWVVSTDGNKVKVRRTSGQVDWERPSKRPAV